MSSSMEHNEVKAEIEEEKESVVPTEDIEAQPSESKTTISRTAPIRNLYVAAMSYNGYTFTDGALRLIVLLHADDLGFNAIEIAFMFTAYELAGVFTNLFGSIAGSVYGLRWTLLSSLFLQIACLAALTQTGAAFGDLKEAGTSGNEDVRLQATIYITAWQTLAGVAKDFMKLTGKSTPKLVTKEGAEGRLFQLVAWLTGMKNAIKGVGHFMGSLLVAQVGYIYALVFLIAVCAVFIPVGYLFMDKDLGKMKAKKIDWYHLFHKGRNVNVLSLARFFLFGSRDIWFEISLPLFLKGPLGWNKEFVGLFLAGYIIIYGNLQALSTKLYKKKDGTAGQPTNSSVVSWAAWCSIVPLVTGVAVYFTFNVEDNSAATGALLVVGLAVFAALFAVNSAVHSYLIVSYSNKDKVSQDLGFYYMGNAMGRLVGTLMGGFVYHYSVDDFGLSLSLVLACPFLVSAAIIGTQLQPPLPGKSPLAMTDGEIVSAMQARELGMEETGDATRVQEIEMEETASRPRVQKMETNKILVK